MRNYVDGKWIECQCEHRPVVNPATAEVLAEVSLCESQEVDQAVRAAAGAFAEWRRSPPSERV